MQKNIEVAQPLLHPGSSSPSASDDLADAPCLSSSSPSPATTTASGSELDDEKKKTGLLVAGCTVMLLQWVATSLFSPFFPKSPQAAGVSKPVKGAIFAAFDLGVVLAGPLVDRLVTKHSGSSVAMGVLLMGAFSLCFGLTPFLLAPGTARTALFFTFNLLAGGTSTFAAVGVYALFAQGFPGNRGTSTLIHGLDSLC